MADTTPRGIQATLFDYFQDTEYFTIQDANELVLEHQGRDVNAESIRARIYEGIDKGLFERVGKGLYMVTRDNEDGSQSSCLLINGDGRDLSMFPDSSIEAIITDHPYQLTASLKGGNRNFADYELFQYNEEDFREKHRVLKPGHFLVEFLPEENADNYRYLFQVKEMARKAGMVYYAKVGWKKGDFVANTGRKSKNTEDVVFFSKGKARALRPDAQKQKKYDSSHTTVEFEDHIPGSTTVHYSDMGGVGSSSETTVAPIDVKIRISVLKEDEDRARTLLESAWNNFSIYSCENSPLDVDQGGEYSYEELLDMPAQDYILKYLEKAGLSFDDLSKGPVEHFMSGAQGMLPTVFDFAAPSRATRIHQAEKPVELLEEILRFVTLPGETALDQFAGSGVLGEAALRTGRNSILIEKDEETFQKITQRLQALGTVEALTPASQILVNLGAEAIVAQDAFNRTGDRGIISRFVETHDIPDPSVLYEGEQNIWNATGLTEDQKEAVTKAFEAIEDIVLRGHGLDLSQQAQEVSGRPKPAGNAPAPPRTLECSSRGDRRFSALFAQVTINGKTQSIEEWYLNARRTADGKKAGKGKAYDHIRDPFAGDKLPVSDAPWLYRGLWITYLKNNPDLVEYASQFDEFTDSFRDPNDRKRQLDAYEEDPFNEENVFFFKHPENLSGADVVGAYAKGDREQFVAVVKASHWYKNMLRRKKPPLSEQIHNAESKQGPGHISPGSGKGNKPIR